MFNPPVIKPKKYAGGGAVISGPAGLALGNQFIEPIVAPNAPESIQRDLDSLTNDLKEINSRNRKVKTATTKVDEKKEYEDIEEFRNWIKENTETDDDGQVYFIQPRTKERVAIDSSPEGNVLLYEVFKEQTGRAGEAWDAIADLDIRQFQQSPEGVGQTTPRGQSVTDADKEPEDERSGEFRERLESLRESKMKGDVFNKQSPVGNPEAMAAYASVPFDGSVVGTVAKGEAMRGLARSEAIRANEESKQILAYRKPGEKTFSLTPEPVTLQEATELGYELAPKELAQENFMQKAILAGRVPMGDDDPMNEKERLQTDLLRERLRKARSALDEDVDSPFMHKKFVKVELPGLYTNSGKDNLQFNVRLQENDKGDVQYDPDVNLNPIIRDIYKAEEYAARTKEEIDIAKEMISGYTVGSAQLIDKAVSSIAGILGIDRRELFDENGNQVIPTATLLRRWAKRFTAQNITTILGESNRTISDADRKRADDIVSILGNTTDIADAMAALNELVKIFEAPSRNANIALQSLYSLAETSPQGGYLDQVLNMERSVVDQIRKSGMPLVVPQSSQFYFEETNRPTGVTRTIDLTTGG
tara:strand:- start:336 stop:2105 length:1770 start_codon:yes stop_codon:yes gene_type:complete